jgi:hypothetical protein
MGILPVLSRRRENGGLDNAPVPNEASRLGGIALAMRRMLAGGAFDQAEIDLMIEAYDTICRELHLAESKYNAANETVALAVMNLVRSGERNVKRITRQVLQSIQPPQT